jgi:hypothetical protein
MQHFSKISVIGVVILLLAITSFASAQGLTVEEESWLKYMREEEKLARDVYNHFSELFPDARIFANIADSEQTHMDAIKTLLLRYGVEDPAKDDIQGKFYNEKIQALYDELTAPGNDTLVDALNVGVFIEVTDIDDLEKAMAETKRTDIKRVYSNLYNGSLNHLDAFLLNLANQNAPKQKGKP